MKKILHFSLFAFLILMLASCAKQVDIIVQPASDPINGNWYISDASDFDGSSWGHFDAGVYGTFSIFSNGALQYVDGNVLMQGSWSTSESFAAYYDANANYRNDRHQIFSLYANDAGGNSINLYFDDIVFNGNNQFVATYYTGKSVEVYTFDRTH